MNAPRLSRALYPSSSLMAARRRTAAVARHMASPPPESTAPEGEAHREPEPEVLHDARGSVRYLRLNRPKALNALNTGMIRSMKRLIETWSSSPEANAIVLEGTGRAFCAGGDVVGVVKLAQHDEQRAEAIAFFKEEYDLDQQLAHLDKPAIAILDGITMGGGVGLSVHLPFRVVTEKTVFSMPETTIGLFPDVGATFFLARMDGQLGRYLGLTSERLTGYAAYHAGVGTHFVPSGNLSLLHQRLVDLSAGEATITFDMVDGILEEYAADASFIREYREKQPPIVGDKRRAIDHCFRHRDAEKIIRDLRSIERRSIKAFATSGLESWAKETADTMEKRSPTSVKVSLRAIRDARDKDIDAVFKSDLQLAATFCTPSVTKDFVTGVTHQLINKQRETRAEWDPTNLEGVSNSFVERTFFGHEPAEGVEVPPLAMSSAALSDEEPPSTSYHFYPHGGRGLPSEARIRKLVTGEASHTGSFAITEKEVLDILRREYRRATGKAGLEDKVAEVIERMCIRQGEDGQQLSWNESDVAK